MAYLVNQTRAHNLTINGVNYTDNLLEFSCSDSSALRAGIITTKGQLTLGYKGSGLDISEYKKMLFKRGQLVILDMTRPNGTTFRHPRGYLYVISVSYNPNDNTNTIELGCRLALAELTGNVDNLLGYSTWELPEERQDFNNLSAYLMMQGKVLYQTNQGPLSLVDQFPTGNLNGAWASVLGETALDVSPISGNVVIPDKLQLTFSVNASDSEDVDYTVINEQTTTYYELDFPVKKIIRVPPDNGVEGIGGSLATAINSGNNSNCGGTITPDGNDPTAGRDNDTESCSENFTVEESVQYISARNISISKVYNIGPAGQVNYREQSMYGPALELQSSYFTDKYNYCIQKYVTACNPAGFCSPGGSSNVLQAKQLTNYRYDSDGTLFQTVTENYRHILAAAQPQDWRAITIDTETGEEREEFRDGILDALANGNTQYLDSLVIEDIIYNEDNGSKSITTTYNSLASRGIGIKYPSKLDARAYGIKTVEVKVSATKSLNPSNPDRTNNTTQAEANETEDITIEKPIRLFGQRYVTPPQEAGQYIAVESLPIDFNDLDYSLEQKQELAQEYLRYITKCIKGEALGYRISEGLRPGIINTWAPMQPFSYVDPVSGEILRLVADAAAWAVNSDGAAVTLSGLWVGFSNGTYVPSSN